ncbi:unnamed protein product [Cunninghamella blakesleeana]
MVHIHYLPDELLLSIFQLIKKENHLNLLYIANTCKRFQRISVDYSLWKNTIILDHRTIISKDIRPIPFPTSYTKLNAKEIFILDSNQSEMDYLKNILLHYNNSTMVDINILSFNPIHYWNVLTKYNNYIRFQNISIASIDNTATTTNTFNNDDTELFAFLINIQNHLQSLSFPLLPLQKLINHHTSSILIFPNIYTLNIGLIPDLSLDWIKVKLMFPNLKQLSLHSLTSNMNDFWKTIRILWSSPDLFPWLESMTIVQENVTNSTSAAINAATTTDAGFSSSSITKDEIVATLSRLNGLIRIDTGCWDIIAV